MSLFYKHRNHCRICKYLLLVDGLPAQREFMTLTGITKKIKFKSGKMAGESEDKMKLYRYMSFNEFNKMNAGITIVGKRSFKARTNSEGICFLGEKTPAETYYTEYDENDLPYSVEVNYTFTPEDCMRFLCGIVSKDILVEFETDSTNIRESWGTYSDPYGEDCMGITEYCTPSYNRDTFIPVRYAIPNNEFCDGFVWYPFN